MSLGIFSFDLAALIDRLSNLIEIADPETVSAVEISLDQTEDVLQGVSATGTIIDDVLTAAALNSAVTSVIAAREIVSKEDPSQKSSVPKTAAQRPAQKLDEETRREIERLIKSLQTSVIHNYKSNDIIDKAVALNNVANFPKRKTREDSGRGKESVEEQKKIEERRLEILREELKRAVLRSNTGV